ncbi:MAG TPA: phosphoribosyltransferase domain-containing protein [Allosphingosinicella sp.]
MPEPEFLYLSHERFLEEVETIAALVEGDSWRPDFLIGIGRGGLVPAAFLSHRLALPLLTVDHSTGEPGFGEELLAKLAAKLTAGARMLIVDDINDSGGTITFLRGAIEAKIDDPSRLRVAVLIHNIRSRALAEYHGSEIDRDADKRWYVFPWEALASRATLAADAAAVPERIA